MRPVITEQEAEELIMMIPTIDEPWINNERERERNYKEVIKSNKPEKLIGIIKLIYQRKKLRQEQGKKTTIVDKQYFDKAENLLYSELELALGKSREEIYDQIKNQCEKVICRVGGKTDAPVNPVLYKNASFTASKLLSCNLNLLKSAFLYSTGFAVSVYSNPTNWLKDLEKETEEIGDPGN